MHFRLDLAVAKTHAILDLQVLREQENTGPHAQLLNLESDERHIVHPRSLEEESKLIEAVLKYVRHSDRDSAAVYHRKWCQPQ